MHPLTLTRTVLFAVLTIHMSTHVCSVSIAMNVTAKVTATSVVHPSIGNGHRLSQLLRKGNEGDKTRDSRNEHSARSDRKMIQMLLQEIVLDTAQGQFDRKDQKEGIESTAKGHGEKESGVEKNGMLMKRRKTSDPQHQVLQERKKEGKGVKQQKRREAEGSGQRNDGQKAGDTGTAKDTRTFGRPENDVVGVAAAAAAGHEMKGNDEKRIGKDFVGKRKSTKQMKQKIETNEFHFSSAASFANGNEWIKGSGLVETKTNDGNHGIPNHRDKRDNPKKDGQQDDNISKRFKDSFVANNIPKKGTQNPDGKPKHSLTKIIVASIFIPVGFFMCIAGLIGVCIDKCHECRQRRRRNKRRKMEKEERKRRPDLYPHVVGTEEERVEKRDIPEVVVENNLSPSEREEVKEMKDKKRKEERSVDENDLQGMYPKVKPIQ